MLLNKLILDQDPTFGDVVTSLVSNAVIFATIGRAAAVGRAAGIGEELTDATLKAGRLRTAAQAGVALTKETLLVQVMVQVQGQAASLIDKGRILNADEQKMLIAQSLASLVGIKVADRLAGDRLFALGTKFARRETYGIDVTELKDTRRAMLALINELAVAPDLNNRAAVEAHVAKAQALLAFEHQYLQGRRDIQQRLQELAKTKPGLFDDSELAQLSRTADEAITLDLLHAEALLGLDQVGPGFFHADSRSMDAILTLRKRSGGAHHQT